MSIPTNSKELYEKKEHERQIVLVEDRIKELEEKLELLEDEYKTPNLKRESWMQRSMLKKINWHCSLLWSNYKIYYMLTGYKLWEIEKEI